MRVCNTAAMGTIFSINQEVIIWQEEKAEQVTWEMWHMFKLFFENTGEIYWNGGPCYNDWLNWGPYFCNGQCPSLCDYFLVGSAAWIWGQRK